MFHAGILWLVYDTGGTGVYLSCPLIQVACLLALGSLGTLSAFVRPAHLMS